MRLLSLVFILLLAGATNLVNSQTSTATTAVPGYQCTPFVFPNGSNVSFQAASQFVGWFPQMAQSTGGNYDWGMSLCNAAIRPLGSPACAQGYNMVQTSQCAVTVAGNPMISAMYDGTGVIFTFAPATQADNNVWANTINCVCDPTQNNLNSPSNAYAITINLPNVAATWTMSSSGCCVNPPAPTTPTPTPASTCSPFTFINGSVVSLNNFYKLAAEFPQMAQQGTGGSFDWAMSLCAPQYQVQSAPVCATGFYMSRSSTCTAQISTSRAIVVSPDGYALQFKFSPSPQSDGYTWTNVVTCLCDRSSSGLVSPSNSYYVSVQGVQVNATWTLTSDACCVETPSTTTTVPTTTTITTTTSPPISCTPFVFPNGSKISFSNPSHFVGWFPQMAQSGGGNYDWGMSLCDPSVQARGSPACATGNNMVSTTQCSVAVAGNPTISAMADGTGITFAFAPATQTDDNIWTNTVNCACNPLANDMYAPSNSYTVDVMIPNIGATWVMASSGCCIDTPTTTPSPSGSNNNNNDDAVFDKNSFAFGAGAGVAGLVILAAMFFFVKKACTSAPSEPLTVHQRSFNYTDELHAP